MIKIDMFGITNLRVSTEILPDGADLHEDGNYYAKYKFGDRTEIKIVRPCGDVLEIKCLGGAVEFENLYKIGTTNFCELSDKRLAELIDQRKYLKKLKKIEAANLKVKGSERETHSLWPFPTNEPLATA